MNDHLPPSLTEHKIKGDHDVRNPNPGLGQAQKCGDVKMVNCLLNLP